MLPKSYEISAGGKDTQIKDIQIGDKSVQGGKCIAKMLVVVTEEDFDPMQVIVTASADSEHYNIKEFEKMWDAAKKKHIQMLQNFEKLKK